MLRREFLAGTSGAIAAAGATKPAILLRSGWQTVNIGEGILPTGTGDVARSGLFAGDAIQLIVNQGLGSDIRGDVIVGGPTVVKVSSQTSFSMGGVNYRYCGTKVQF